LAVAFVCPGGAASYKKKELIFVPEVRLGEGESFESLLRRFTRKVQQEGIISEVRRRGFFEKPSIKRKRKEATKRRKTNKTA
jgi:small subunit ribosomal protein S21